jgi:hypothetical protein
MAIQLSTAVRNARIAAIETTIGTGPRLQIRTGAAPATPATADSGTLLVEITLASDWLGAPSAGSASLIGTPNNNAVAAGTAGHYRLKDSTGATCHEQGTVTATGGGGDMTVDNVSIGSGQQVTLTGYRRTDGNA